jgi:hypothetical protein
LSVKIQHALVEYNKSSTEQSPPKGGKQSPNVTSPSKGINEASLNRIRELKSMEKKLGIFDNMILHYTALIVIIYATGGEEKIESIAESFVKYAEKNRKEKQSSVFDVGVDFVSACLKGKSYQVSFMHHIIVYIFTLRI